MVSPPEKKIMTKNADRKKEKNIIRIVIYEPQNHIIKQQINHNVIYQQMVMICKQINKWNEKKIKCKKDEEKIVTQGRNKNTKSI